jgi:hypothetical protein
MEVEDLHNENYRTLKKRIEEDTRRWKDLLCSWSSIRILDIKANRQRSLEKAHRGVGHLDF